MSVSLVDYKFQESSPFCFHWTLSTWCTVDNNDLLKKCSLRRLGRHGKWECGRKRKCAGLRRLQKSCLWHGKQKEATGNISLYPSMKIFILLKLFSDYQIHTYSKKDCAAMFLKNCITSVGGDVEQRELSYVTTKEINWFKDC